MARVQITRPRYLRELYVAYLNAAPPWMLRLEIRWRRWKLNRR
jgi:hypothetical protein